MKKLKEIGKQLNRNQMRQVVGGSIQCTTQKDCSCGKIPEPLKGQICSNGICKTVSACP